MSILAALNADFCKAKIGKNVLLLRETAHIVLLMEKMVLREFRRAIA